MTTLATYTLPQMLNEMDRAIGDEINEINKRSYTRSGYTATDGNLLSEDEKLYIYQFSLETSWEPQDDTPIKVVIVGMPEIHATIVTSNGTLITIATDEPLPPEALDKAHLVDDPTQLLERLREALKNNKEGTSSIGSKCFALKPAAPIQKTQCVYFGEKFKPDESQEKAIQMALQNETTYIIGPPGTGKTYTLAAIAFAHLRAGHSVLIAAHTNIAIDNAIMRLADICKDASTFDRDALKDLSGGRIVRYGIPQLKDRLKNEHKEVYLPSIVEQRSQFLSQQQKTLRAKLDNISTQLNLFSQQQRQKPDIWQQTKASYTAQKNHFISELQTLKADEEKRVAYLQSQLSQISAKKTETVQELNKILQELSYLNSQQVQLQTMKDTLVENANDFSAKLAKAQQMSSIMRLMKGIDSKALEKKLADTQYQIWQMDQQAHTIQNHMSEKHYKRSVLEQQIAKYDAIYPDIQKQIPILENDRKKFEELQRKIDQYSQAIANGDTQSQRERISNEQQLRAFRDEQTQINGQLATIEKQLSEVEKNIIAEARVIGTTLCKVYMNSNLRERQFDVVIMDEVSMAPLPSLYIAASRANRSVVTIGDPRQLAPICIANDNSKVAEQWLGTDLFTQLGISFDEMRNDYSVLLDTQARMHPAISKIAREHVYEGRIKDRPNMNHEKYSDVEPLPGKQLILCDTSNASPVTTNPRGSGRINMYHALCTIEIARQVLASLPPLEHELQRGEFRIGLVTPYRKQAQLLQSLIQDTKLKDVVQARTVHKFQGLEAEVIIFDTVESSGKPIEFTSGLWGSAAMKLINVAVTRAKHKLIIVANLQHITKVFPARSILRLAVEEAQAGGVIKSREILRNQFNTSQRRATKDSYPLREIQFTREEGKFEFYNEHTFYERFLQDIHAATKSVVILSPFLGIIRAKSVAPTFVQKIKEGVNVIVITSELKDDDKTENAREQFEKAGAEIRIQPAMHEKLIFIDEKIVFYGSLNALSYIESSNSELMIRSVLPHFVKQCWDFVKVYDKLHAPKWSKNGFVEQKGIDIVLPVKDLPVTSNCQQCGRKMEPQLVNKTGLPFYGCKNFFSATHCKFTIDVTEDDVRSISTLKNIVCESCGSMGTIKKIPYQGFWFECSKCSYRNRITFTR